MSSYAIIIRIRDVHVHRRKHIRVQCEIHRCIYVNVYEKNTYMPRVEKEARESRKEANHLRKSFSRKVEKFSAKARQFGSAAGAVSKSSVPTSYIAKKKKKNRC
jgi:hypothetical protein